MKSKSNHQKTWEIYTAAWKCTQHTERLELFKQSLDLDCCYTDPLTITTGWEALIAYMEEFHKQVPVCLYLAFNNGLYMFI